MNNQQKEMKMNELMVLMNELNIVDPVQNKLKRLMVNMLTSANQIRIDMCYWMMTELTLEAEQQHPENNKFSMLEQFCFQLQIDCRQNMSHDEKILHA